MVVVLVEVLNAQTPTAQAAWMVVVEVTWAFMGLIIAEGTCRFLANKLQKSGSEPNFDVKSLTAEGESVLNWDLTPISSPSLVEASLDCQPSNERLLFSPGGAREGGG
jgi:hypothetical protein